MSVEARELMADIWTRWQGQLINGVFPLGRYIGCSEHSGVFATKRATQEQGEVAIKLLAADRDQEEAQIPRWDRTCRLAQPHLLPLFEWGGCQLEGLPYRYIVMEYADQTLAQLLVHRALTADETQQMLLPILEGLRFLHGNDLVHGRLRPTNIMVVGEQLKLASDTLRRVGEGPLGRYAPSVYDPPEGQARGSSPAGDIWALGVNLFEALTREPPARADGHLGKVVIPADFPPTFREIVSRCLSFNPLERPSISDLSAWAGMPAVRQVPLAPAAPAPLKSSSPPEGAATRAVPSPAAARTVASSLTVPNRRAWWVLTLAFVVILTLGWTVTHRFNAHRAADAVASTGAEPPASAPSIASSNPDGGEAAASLVALHEVLPEVPQRAAHTIRGHIKVSVRATIDSDGSVSAVVAERPGTSRYFRRLAIEAALQWKFPPSRAASRRLMQIQFDFSRDGTTSRALPVR